MGSQRSTMILRLVPIVLLIVVVGIGLSDAHFATAQSFEVPESAYHQYTRLAVDLARFKSMHRRPALYLLGLRRVVWLRRKRNQVVITIDVADSTCKRWPRNLWDFNCKPQVNSPLYSCRGRALVRDGVQLVKFLWTKCWKSVCRKQDYIGYSF